MIGLTHSCDISRHLAGYGNNARKLIVFRTGWYKKQNMNLSKSSVLFRKLSQECLFVQRFAAMATGAPNQKLDSNLHVFRCSPQRDETRPLVLLFGWMLAKPKHVQKYGNLYLSRGFDVLRIQVRPAQVLVPSRAHTVISNINDFLEGDSCKTQPLLVHGFSVGGYLFGEFLVRLKEEKQKLANIRSRLLGQIFDSPVDFEGVPRGFSKILVEQKILQLGLERTIEIYLALMKSQVTKYYIRSSAAFHENELLLPSLMLYSRNDPIGDANIIEQVAEKWRTKGTMVRQKCWEESPHVSHFHHHPDEYVDSILSFLEEIGLAENVLETEQDEMKVRIP